ncbi:hypothetical protein [Helicobacter saguini]|nr:hypothetical protein [Helicobacter saguini]
MKMLMLSLIVFIIYTGCSNAKMKPPKKSPCACYDIIIDMENKNV